MKRNDRTVVGGVKKLFDDRAKKIVKRVQSQVVSEDKSESPSLSGRRRRRGEKKNI